MTRFYVATLMLVAIISPALSQHIDDTYRPVIKETPLDLKIVQHTDNNYLLYGDFNYAGSEESGSLVKVDVTGKPVASFNKLYTNHEYAVTEGQRSAISVDNLPTGMFIVTVTSQGKSRRFKLIRRAE